ncbi:hypothetical protein T492DRAFT_840580 [Pavlovales sp. CCMP2436]|nr:hypothetical protein T492DRAFT_840580 [Pavlovales sp. CCMP2436]
MPLPFGLSASGAELERHAHLDDFPTGDYQLRVTIIEATALAARDASATSDPYVIVTVGAHSLRTSVSRKTISTTWGHVMSFELPGLTQARAGLPLIGATMIDLLKVF